MRERVGHGEMVLGPTLWRTCRVLANERRLAILDHLIREGERCVTEIAEELELPESAASENLRALNARGLIRADRRGRRVVYTGETDPALPMLKPLFAAIQRTVRTRPNVSNYLFLHFTAFTHPRRIEIMRVLDRTPADLGEIFHRTAIPKPALVRHLNKLIQRGYIQQIGDRFRARSPKDPVPRALLHLARS